MKGGALCPEATEQDRVVLAGAAVAARVAVPAAEVGAGWADRLQRGRAGSAFVRVADMRRHMRSGSRAVRRRAVSVERE